MSEPNSITDYPDILRYGAGIPTDDYLREERGERVLKTFIDEAKLGFETIGNTFVSPETLKSWMFKGESSYFLNEIWKAAQIHIPHQQKYLGSILDASLIDALSKEEAILSSMYHTTRLWCEKHSTGKI